ncbi:MAG: hypothetical protein IPO19_14155 [Rhodoferax sp.]|nr:hypothetical protein [Rhodoferax sp.]
MCPFVTLAGRPAERAGQCDSLQGLGHPEWIATTEDEYIQIAVAMADDLPKLATTAGGIAVADATAP